MARPRKPFDWHLVESLAQLQATEVYICERLLIGMGEKVNKKSIDATIRLLQRRIREEYGISFVEYKEQKLEHYKIQLAQAQWESAIVNKNVAMQIWLGKQYLKQSEKVEQKQEVKAEVQQIEYVAQWGGKIEAQE